MNIKKFEQSLLRAKYWILSFFLLFLVGCAPEVIDNRFENTAEAQFFDFSSELCTPEQIEHLCQNCSDPSGNCATVTPEWQCWVGWSKKEDWQACVEKKGSEACNLTYCSEN